VVQQEAARKLPALQGVIAVNICPGPLPYQMAPCSEEVRPENEILSSVRGLNNRVHVALK
jgi:hypothetical protein